MLQYSLYILAAILVLGTAASIFESDIWWIRVWDFPRLAVACVGMLCFVLAALLLREQARWIVLAAMIFVIGWQFFKIYPYTPLGSPEVAFIDGTEEAKAGHCVTLMNLNVYQYNRDFGRAAAMIKQHDPDVLLLLETDKGWEDGLREVLDAYPHQTLQPQDNTYGLLFVSKLDVDSAQIRFLIEEDVPSIFAQIRTPSGRAFQFIGLHPKPPIPGQNTTERDAEIALAAKMAKEETLPVVAMGDFNDVAWSKTSRMFKRLGTYLDPRIGRGFYSTFPAKIPFFRWPLDHIFMTEQFTVRSVAVLPDVGSDHLPVLANICLSERIGDALNEEPEEITAEDEKDAAEMMQAAEDKKEEEQAKGDE